MDEHGVDPDLEAIRERMRKELSTATQEPAAHDSSYGAVAVDDEGFAREIAKPGIVVVDFWAEWCRPCLAMAPAYEAAALALAGKARFLKLNVDENPRTAMEWEIRSIPTVLMFKDGKGVDGFLGAVTQAELVERVRRWTR